MNAAYKHLEAKLRIGELTIGQWFALFVGVLTAIVWGFYLSPFGSSLTIFSACYIGGIPAAAIFLATMSEVNIPLMARAAVRWRREEGRYLAGGGTAPSGYVVDPDPAAERAEAANQLPAIDLGALWES